MRGGGVEEPPVLPVLQQQVGVDEQDAGEENVTFQVLFRNLGILDLTLHGRGSCSCL